MTVMSDAVVTVKGLGKCYPINEAAKPAGGWRASLQRLCGRGAAGGEENRHWALQDLNFTVHRGDRVGIIGSNGAGKSTLLKIMSRVAYPTAGEVRISGSLTSLLEVGTGFNENLSGRENVYLNASLHGMHRAEIDSKFEDIVRFSEIGRFIDTPIKHYSSGMRMRLAFSVAAHLDPDILLLDEVLAVGDMSFQRKCLERVDELTDGGRTLFFVSHSMDSIIRYCNRCIWLEGGRVQADGDVQEIVSAYVENVMNVKSKTVLIQADGHVTKEGAAPHVPIDHPVPLQGERAQHEEPSDGVPGDARLRAAKVVDSQGNNKTLFNVSEQIGVEIEYEILQPGMYMPGIHLYCPQGTLLFVATLPDTDVERFKAFGPRVIRATAWLPRNIFNIGSYSISIEVFNPMESPFRRYFSHRHLLSFHCTEVPIGELSARGLMPRAFPGPIRPLLDWSMQQIGG